MKVATMRVDGYDAPRGHAEIRGDLRWNVSGRAFFPSGGSHGQERGQCKHALSLERVGADARMGVEIGTVRSRLRNGRRQGLQTGRACWTGKTQHGRRLV